MIQIFLYIFDARSGGVLSFKFDKAVVAPTHEILTHPYTRQIYCIVVLLRLLRVNHVVVSKIFISRL